MPFCSIFAGWQIALFFIISLWYFNRWNSDWRYRRKRHGLEKYKSCQSFKGIDKKWTFKFIWASKSLYSPNIREKHLMVQNCMFYFVNNTFYSLIILCLFFLDRNKNIIIQNVLFHRKRRGYLYPPLEIWVYGSRVKNE